MKMKMHLKFLSILLVLSLLMDIVSISEAKSKVNLNKTKVTLCIGDSITLKLKNSKNKPDWSSNKKSVVTVSSSGKVTAKKAGAAKITAKVGKNKYNCKITVPKQYISKASLTLDVGENKEISIYGVSDNSNIIWKSSDKKIATVSDGIINGVSNGIATISGTVNNGKGKTYKCTVIVYSYESPDSKPTPTVKPTQTPLETANPTITPIVTQKPISTLKPPVGDDIIPTAPPINVTNPPSDIQPTNPTIPVNGITISETNVTFNLYETKYLSANVLPLNATNKNIIWISTNDNIVKVDNYGMITAISEGTTKIIATSEEGGYSTSCVVTVVYGNSSPTPSLSPSPSSNPSVDKQTLLTEENIRYELELSEIELKYKGEIQIINNAIYFATLHDDYYKGTAAQYSAEVNSLTKEIASIEKQIAALSGDNSEEARLRISKLKKEWQYYDDKLNTLEDQWALRVEIDEYRSILVIINNEYEMAVANAEEKHKKILEEIMYKNI